MKFMTRFGLSAVLAVGLLSAGAFDASANDGKMYDICKTIDVAVAVATELRDINQGDVAEHGPLINSAHAADMCVASPIDFGDEPIIPIALITGEVNDYVVTRVMYLEELRYAVVEQEKEPVLQTAAMYDIDTMMDDIFSATLDAAAGGSANPEGKGDLPAGVKIPVTQMCSVVLPSDFMTTAFVAAEPCQ